MWKNFFSLLLAAMMLLGALSSVYAEDIAKEPEEKVVSFSDVPEGHPAYEAVMFLAKHNIICGKSETEFAPSDTLKREEFAKIIANSFELAEPETTADFNDVANDAWYAPFVSKVAATGLMIGISDTEFGAGMTLTRQDLALILKRFIDTKNPIYTVKDSTIYADTAEIAEYAKDAVLTLSAGGYMSGRSEGLWCPKEDATRAETAVALYNLLGNSRYGYDDQYEGPFVVPENDRLAESMPTPFNANIWPKEEVLYEDFNDDDFGPLTLVQDNEHIDVIKDGGYDGSGCLKITDGGWARFEWKTTLKDANAGDWFVLSAMMKGENIEGTGEYRTILQAYDDKGNWLDETHQYKRKTNSDWIETQQLLMVPEGENELEPPESYTIYLTGYMYNLKGEAYFDDFKLYKIKFDPMDTILMSPNYKGIIKGEGGVADIKLRAYVNDGNGFFNLSNLDYTAQITDENHNVLSKIVSDKVVPVMDVYLSSKDLPMGGDYYLESILTDKNTGEEIQKQEWPLHKREADFKTKYGFDEYDRVTLNGEPVFPIRLYNYTSYEEGVNEVAESEDIDVLIHTGYGWVFNHGSSPVYADTVKKLLENGKEITMTLQGFCFGNLYSEPAKRISVQEDVRALATKAINNYKDLPNFFGYYIFDEQNGIRYGDEIAWLRKIVELNDLDHPTTCAIDKPITDRPGVYAKTSDFLGYDIYPVTGKDNQDIARVTDRLLEGKRLTPNRPAYIILQSFWYNTRGDLRGPNQAEFRNMAFQAICAGSCMLDTWSYEWMRIKPNPGSTFEQDWAAITPTYAEIQKYEPIILSADPAPYYEIVENEGKWLNTLAKRYDGKSYLFTVNNQNEEKSAKIYLDGVTEIHGLTTGKTYTADEKGIFNIKWDALEVEIFEYEQEDYKSSHADMRYFGFADTVIVDSESETPSFIINNGKTEVAYTATISDYATLYINGKQVETSGTLNINGLNEINVKVVSEDGRGVLEKTFKLERH